MNPEFIKVLGEVKNVPELKENIERSLDQETTIMLETLLGGVIALGASDLHIEPGRDQAQIRIRIDGILQEVISLDKKIYETILSRIKLLSGAKLNITDRPQAGRFSVLSAQTPIEIRTSTLPAENGEAVVLRILNPQSLVEMEALGVRPDLLSLFKAEVKRPNGMIIVTGPTGSGKTTTLYAFLKKIRRPEIKIITIEDPIEYHLQGVSQTQTAPEKGYDFASGLKSIMRQDPNVILVGEIKDLETAKIAIQAALTGHLVLTTLHTNDAAGVIARLTSLGEKLPNLGPAINLAIAQRLVRKVCKKCSKLKKTNSVELKKLKTALGELSKKIRIPKITDQTQIPQTGRCKQCSYTGYQGRIGIFEAFLVNDEMERFILQNPSIAALREKIVKQGMVLMKQDGFIKVLEGITTIEEVERVTGE